MAKIRHLACACCDGDAGRFQQWHNRDTGYGVCADCIAWMRRDGRETEAEITDYYGVEGVNFAARKAA